MHKMTRDMVETLCAEVPKLARLPTDARLLALMEILDGFEYVQAQKVAEIPPEFLRLRQLYPKRDGHQRWGDAYHHWRARIKEGHAMTAMEDGVMRYAKYCTAKGITGTELVMQAATFFGINRAFLESWTAPAPAAEKLRGGHSIGSNLK